MVLHLNGGIPFSMLVMWCCCPLLMAGEKDMSLPVFIPLNVVMLFISVSPLYLQGFGLTWFQSCGKHLYFLRLSRLVCL
jgi:hypothetical protein